MGGQHHYDPNSLPSVNWTFPANNRLLIEAGASVNIFTNSSKRQPGLGTDTIAITELSNNFRYGARGNQLGNVGGSYTTQLRRQYHQRLAVSYVTGSHNFKTGLDLHEYTLGADGIFRDPNQINGARDYTFRDRVPTMVRIWAVPFGTRDSAENSLAGFNVQLYNWQGSVSVQQELRRNMALNVGYFRTWYGGFLATDNLAVTPADYDQFCITAPSDARLPGGGGNQVCGLFDLKPALFGQVSNLVTQSSHYGKRTQIFNGVDVTVNARFGQGGQFSGGLSTGRTATHRCEVLAELPEALLGATTANTLSPNAFCRVSPPWSAGTNVKFLVVYPLPWGLQTSAIYQNIPGIPITSTYVATNAEIRPSLGRNLGQCGALVTCNATVTIDLIPPSTLFEDRLHQVDLRVTRIFRFGQARVQGNIDLYNMFNASNVLNMNTRYGLQWLNVVQIMGGHLVKFSGQIDF